MEQITLRPYQQECINKINQLKSGAHLVVLFTGAGKTVIFSHINRPGRMLILSHREELVYQPKKYFDCSFGVERAEETSNGEEVISASVQSLKNRLDKFAPDTFDTIIVDEAHHAVAPSYRAILDHFSGCRLQIGFTATPNRADHAKLGEIYSSVIYEHDLKWGISHGYLTDIRCYKANMGYNLRNIKMSMGDFQQNQLSQCVDRPEFNQAVAKIYQEKAVGQTLIFGASVEHCRHLQKLIKGSEMLCATTENRQEILERFRKKETRCIINNLILTEGTDLPMIETLIMCRPTTNISLYTQCVGRGLRLYPGKKELLLIDCVGNSKLPLCTATDLFGLDTSSVKNPQKLNGQKLTDIEKTVRFGKEKLALENKKAWEVNYERVKLFEKMNGYFVQNVNYIVLPDKSFRVDTGSGASFTITAEDLIGNTNVYATDKANQKRVIRTHIKMQDAFNLVHEILLKKYAKDRMLWDMEYVNRWGKGKASAKQIDYIRDLYTRKEQKEINFKELTKYAAMCLIAAKKK